MRKVKGDLEAIVWKDKQNISMLTNLHCSPAEGNFYNKYGTAMQPATAQDYQTHEVCR
jgi:hypothetical protein